MKTIKRSSRVWFAAVLFISAGALSLRAIWAEAIDPTSAKGKTGEDCQITCSQCLAGCLNKYGNLEDWYGPCRHQCLQDFANCVYRRPAAIGAGAPGQNLPPNA